MNEEQEKLLYLLVFDLVGQRYGKILEEEKNGRLSEEEIRRAIEEYPGILTMPPLDTFCRANYIRHYGREEISASGEFELWIDGERSDLTLQVKFIKNANRWNIVIDDIHVM